MNMTKYGLPLTTIALGLALNLVGILSWMLAGPNPSVTALIPNFCGGLFILAGALAFKTSLRPHAMHGALALALLLGLMTGYMAVKELINDGSVRKLFAFETSAALCIGFLVIGVRSFLNARKTRKAAEKANRTANAAQI